MECCCLTSVQEKSVGIIENCGEFSRTAQPGFVCLMYPFEILRERVTLRVRQLDVMCETKTLDNVFVKAHVAVQYQVIPAKVEDAFYKLTDHRAQMRFALFDHFCVQFFNVVYQFVRL